MELNFTIKYAKPGEEFEGLDLYWGAKSLTGIAQALLISIHSFVHQEIILQAPASKGFRVVLGRSYHGSWDQLLSLVVTDQDTLKLINDLGKAALYDLLKWSLLSGVGIKYSLQMRKSKKIIRNLRTQVDDLQERLYKTMKDVHLPVKNQGMTVQVMGGRTLLAQFDKNTLKYLETEVENIDTKAVDVAISRFNTRTGWGRCIEDEDALSVPFSPVRPLTTIQKSILADNLAKLARGDFKTVKAIVSEVTSQDRVLQRYKLHEVIEDN